MLIPLGDEPNPRRRQPVTLLLIALNVLVFFVWTIPLALTRADPSAPGYEDHVALIARQTGMPAARVRENLTAYDRFLFRHGYRATHPEAADVLTSMFLHGSILHLVANLVILWIFGDNVEERLGGARYLSAYVGCGAAAVLVQALIDPASELPSIGASGAISGLLGFYLIWFPENRVRVLVWLGWYWVVIVARARTFLILYVVLANILPLLTSGPGTGIAHGAHIGGFLAGMLLAAINPGTTVAVQTEREAREDGTQETQEAPADREPADWIRGVEPDGRRDPA